MDLERYKGDLEVIESKSFHFAVDEPKAKKGVSRKPKDPGMSTPLSF